MDIRLTEYEATKTIKIDPITGNGRKFLMENYGVLMKTIVSVDGKQKLLESLNSKKIKFEHTLVI